MKKIIIHLGFPKTGTTSIQAMLEVNKDLFGSDVFISAKDNFTRKIRKSQLSVIRNDTKFNKIRRFFAIKRFIKNIKNISSNLIVISDENLIGIDSYSIFNKININNIKYFINKLDVELDKFDIKYILYIRNIDKWQLSCFNQCVKAGSFNKDFEQWKINMISTDNPFQIIKTLKSILQDRLLVVKMEEELSSDLFLGKGILDSCGFEKEILDKILIEPSKNKSLPMAALNFISIIRSKNKKYLHINQIIKYIQDNTNLFYK